MSNYLPVLLVSVNANQVPDDSALSTRPRNQVDYLSHQWEEEDVWRSWRNMTRQKNEIANGIRLENASWRTWWKQRNKLKTVTPETLNWLKDSDVTWLYGPLHTAVEWSPPPKPQPVQDSVNSQVPASTQDRLDLSIPFKPILKHRSISQLLTSDYPPLITVPDSEDDHELIHTQRPTLTHTKSDTHITRWGPSRAFRKDSPPRIDPPGHDPGGDYFPSDSPSSSSTTPSASASYPAPAPLRISLSQDSASSGNGYSHPSATGSGSAGGASANSAGSTTQSGPNEKQKKKHISFNTFVEQCIAIEKPKKNATSVHDVWTQWDDDDGYEEDEEEDSADEDDGDNELWLVDRPLTGTRIASDDALSVSPPPSLSSSSTSSSSHRYTLNNNNPAKSIPEEDDEEDDERIEIRSTSRHTTTTPSSPKQPRSASKISTTSSSSSTSTSTSTNELGPSITVARRLSSSTYRPAQRSATTPSSHPRVTIAPIAPTILKTEWVENFGDEGASDDGVWAWMIGKRGTGYIADTRRGGYGSDSGVTGAGAYGLDSRRTGGEARGYDSDTNRLRRFSGSDTRYPSDGQGFGAEPDDDGTPVELVYVPPFGSPYSMNYGPGGDEAEVVEEQWRDDYTQDDDTVYHRRLSPASSYTAPIHHSPSVSVSVSPANNGNTNIPVAQAYPPPMPTVVVKNTPVQEEDPYDFFGGGAADLGEDYSNSNNPSPQPTTNPLLPVRSRSSQNLSQTFGRPGGLVRSSSQGQLAVMFGTRSHTQTRLSPPEVDRSRSRSRSRTPSPAVVFASMGEQASIAQSVSVAAPPTSSSSTSTSTIPVPLRRSSSATFATASPSSLLSLPPTRGRSMVDVSASGSAGGSGERRGRSSTRTLSGSSLSDRERSSGGLGSPVGSMSPDVVVRGVGGRDRDRGRERTGKRLANSSSSLSPDVVVPGDVVRGRTAGEKDVGKDKGVEIEKAKVKETREKEREEAEAQKQAQARADHREGRVRSEKSGSFSSVSSSATVVPPAKAESIPVASNAAAMTEHEYERRAQEELQRRTHPTPSNSPTIEMRKVPDGLMPNTRIPGPMIPSGGLSAGKPSNIAATAPAPTPPPADHPSPPVSMSTLTDRPTMHTRSSSQSSASGATFIVPSPSLPAPPSTSYAMPKRTKQDLPSPRHDLLTVDADGTLVAKDGSGTLLAKDGTIVGKAVGMVSTAGAFFGLWHGP